MRDRQAEDQASKNSLVDKMVRVREARESERYEKELIQVAQVMVFCGLPYRRTEERDLTRRARLADGTVTVTFKAMVEGVDLPFGSDRTLFHWMTHQAILTGNPFIPLSSASHFLVDMGMSTGGKNITRVKEAFERIASVAIVVDRSTSDRNQRVIMPIVRASNLPKSMRHDQNGQYHLLTPLEPERHRDQLGFRLDESVFSEFASHHVPVLKKLLEVTREKSQLQDYMIFLIWRSFSAESTSTIPWAMVRDQMWQEDSNPWRCKGRFKDAIDGLRIAWPEINAEAADQGLIIGPPTDDRQFLIGTGKTRLD